MDNRIRKTQLITTYGVGQIVPFPNDISIIVAGLEAWPNNMYKNIPQKMIIEEERLTKRLGVKYLFGPQKNTEGFVFKVPTLNFPRWRFCSQCHRMEYVSQFRPGTITCSEPDCNRRKSLVPERFVVICSNGHIDDFPFMRWVHQDPNFEEDNRDHILHREVKGTTTNLGNIRYVCSCGKSRTLSGAYNSKMLQDVYGNCSGSKPWTDSNEKCVNGQIQVTQRGSSNVWFPDVVSSISLPSSLSELQLKTRKKANEILGLLSGQSTDDYVLEMLISSAVAKHGFEKEELWAEIRRLRKGDEDEFREISELDYRKEEFKVLQRSIGTFDSDFFSIKQNISEYPSVFQKYFSGVTLVNSLRETRALVGFTRLNPPIQGKMSDRIKTMISGSSIDWVPAVETYGEGIFIEFDIAFINEWARRPQVISRVKKMTENYNQSSFNKFNQSSMLNPAYILIHTFAHIMITELSIKSGYGSSSIRERIYASLENGDKNMFGVLLYTASGDSEGSLGGLVKIGNHGILDKHVVNAIHKSEWCSSDPICIESKGQGPDSCNLAACHNCALISETCCENGNRLLDRALLIGTLEDPDIGFFAELKG